MDGAVVIAATAPRRVEFGSSEPAEIREFLDALYGVRRMRVDARDMSWRLRLRGVDAGAFSSIDVTLPAHLSFYVDGGDDVVISTLAEGMIGFERGADVDRYAPGDVYLANHSHANDVGHTHEARALTVTLPQALLTDVVRSTSAEGTAWRFTGMNADAAGAARWRHVTRFVDDLLAQPDTAAAPLLLGPAARLLAATAVTVFPNTLLPEHAPADRVDAHPATLHRAVAYIEANPDLDLSVADIARAAYVTPRAVQLAFRRHLGTTPMAHLRRVRLEQAHQQLRNATPGDGVTVTAIAARWGFTPSRFTKQYRAVYGELPSHTLRA